MTSRSGICLLVVALASESAALADPAPSIALDAFEPTPPGDRFFSVQTPQIGGHLVPRTSLTFDYAHEPLSLVEGDDETALVSSQGFLRIAGSLSLWDRALASAEVPFAMVQSGEDPKDATAPYRAPSGAQVGDIRFGARVRLLGKDRSPASFGVSGDIYLPTGGSGSYAGEGAARGAFRLLAGGVIGRNKAWLWSGAFGLHLRASDNPSGATFGAGVGVLMLDGRATLGPELYGAVPFSRGGPLAITGAELAPADATQFELLLGTHIDLIKGLSIGLAAGPGLSGAPGTPAFRVVGVLAWAPSTDDGGVCAGSTRGSGSATKDGCLPEPQGQPAEPRFDETPAPTPEHRKPPPAARPALPESANSERPPPASTSLPSAPSPGPSRGPGPTSAPPAVVAAAPLDVIAPSPIAIVPLQNHRSYECINDTDCDGIHNIPDKCPQTPGVESVDPDRRGCPVDSDGDGISDNLDACPSTNGPSDTDPKKSGCPRFTSVAANAIALNKEIFFKSTGEIFDSQSEALLTEVRDVIIQHPEMFVIEIRGHTDNTGDDRYNLELSQRRADAVRTWLIRAGVSADRLLARGYGESNPLADNGTAAGRAKNRRIEFAILDRK